MDVLNAKFVHACFSILGHTLPVYRNSNAGIAQLVMIFAVLYVSLILNLLVI